MEITFWNYTEIKNRNSLFRFSDASEFAVLVLGVFSGKIPYPAYGCNKKPTAPNTVISEDSLNVSEFLQLIGAKPLGSHFWQVPNRIRYFLQRPAHRFEPVASDYEAVRRNSEVADFCL